MPTSTFLDRMARTAVRMARAAGIDVRSTAMFPVEAWRFVGEFRTYRQALLAVSPKHVLQLYPVLGDSRQAAGHSYGHYFHQDLWAARKIIARQPVGHVDIGSRLDGFIAHLLAAGMNLTVVDLRPLSEPVEGLDFVQADATELGAFADGSIGSLSCLHAIEHFGLGRYGDSIDPLGSRRACEAFARKLAQGGRLLLSAPIGQERTEFNAHRVFHPMRLPEYLPDFSLRDFAAVDDDGRFRQGVEPGELAGARFALGLYDFEKKISREATT